MAEAEMKTRAAADGYNVRMLLHNLNNTLIMLATNMFLFCSSYLFFFCSSYLFFFANYFSFIL